MRKSKIKAENEILSCLAIKAYPVMEALEIFDNRVLHRLRKEGKVTFNSDTRTYHIKQEQPK